MAMTAELWTMSGLATELGHDQRTIGAALATTPPDGDKEYRGKSHKAWFMRTAIAAISARNGGEGIDLKAEQARKAKEEADKLEMQNALMRGELLPAQEVNAAVQSSFARVRARLLALPNKVAPVVLGLDGLPDIQEKLMVSVREALEELSETQVAGVPASEEGEPSDA